MRSTVLAVLGLWITALLPQGDLYGQSGSGMSPTERAVFVVLPEEFRSPDRFGDVMDIPEVETAAGLVIPWNEGADLVLLNPGRLDRESLFVALTTLLNTRQATDEGRRAVMVVRDSDVPIPGLPQLDALLERVQSGRTGWVEGLGRARIVRFDRLQDLAGILGQSGPRD